ncbi:MAG: carboxypeptidase regulatory-like domain-containing protein [Lewinellaceae bacterium]|nr:carboxypeptidase regulatory-like domain-containing protein [Lewinellaceae bacterium]
MKQILISLLLLGANCLNAQTASGMLMGNITDESGEALIGATVKILQKDQLVKGCLADFDGHYHIALEPGKYDVEVSYTGSATLRISPLIVYLEKPTRRDFQLVMKQLTDCCCYWGFHPPLIDLVPGNTGTVFTASWLRRMY